MKKTIHFREFKKEFQAYDRQDNFPEGLEALYYYLTDREIDAECEYELDVIELCCDFNEISIQEIEQHTGCQDLKELKRKTIVIEVNSNYIIYQNF